MSQDLLFDVTAKKLNAYYGTLEISNIRSSRGVTTNYLGFSFESPADVTKADFFSETSPWEDIESDISSQQVDGTFTVTGKINFSYPHTFNGREVFKFGINGNLSSQNYEKTLVLVADRMPSDTVNTETPASG
ncbi:hypothetical protein C0991_003092 [Blastosporella zonata]|nr:hypothetical protein C0991_003092 [Blastosporella zonata]